MFKSDRTVSKALDEMSDRYLELLDWKVDRILKDANRIENPLSMTATPTQVQVAADLRAKADRMRGYERQIIDLQASVEALSGSFPVDREPTPFEVADAQRHIGIIRSTLDQQVGRLADHQSKGRFPF